jgi:polar amino acid transport system substrate-binding protein
MRRIWLNFIVCMTVLSAAFPVFALSDEEAARKLEALDWYSEEYPPYNYKGKDGVPTGMAVDILIAALSKVGANVPAASFKIVPWNESYKRVQRNPGTVLFSTTITPERERMMKFVGPSAPIRVSVIVPKFKNLVIKSPADLSALKIGVVRDDIGDQLIRKFALSDESIAKKDTLKQLAYFFARGRVDAIVYATSVFSHFLKNSDGDPSLYEEAYLLQEGQVGYAFHHGTPNDVLAPLQKALDSLHADGTVAGIISKYTK